jgi:hypothetical protein
VTEPKSIEPERGLDVPKLTMGLFLVGFGLVFLFDRLFWIDGHELFRLWPLWLIGFGAIRVMFPGRRRGRLAGFWPILVGVIFLMDVLEVMSIHDSWPLFIVGGGLLMMLRAMGFGRSCAPRYAPGDERAQS